MSKDSKPTSPRVEAQIERSLAKYKGIATPAMLETMREGLRELLTTHPSAIGLVEQLDERKAPIISGASPVEGAEDEGASGGKAGS